MKRMKVVQEGVPIIYGRVIEPLALVEQSESIPVTYGAYSDVVVGQGRNMERDQDGNITFELEFREEDAEQWETMLDFCGLSITAHDVSGHMVKDTLHIDKATIDGITIVPASGANPGALKGDWGSTNRGVPR